MWPVLAVGAQAIKLSESIKYAITLFGLKGRRKWQKAANGWSDTSYGDRYATNDCTRYGYVDRPDTSSGHLGAGGGSDQRRAAKGDQRPACAGGGFLDLQRPACGDCAGEEIQQTDFRHVPLRAMQELRWIRRGSRQGLGHHRQVCDGKIRLAAAGGDEGRGPDAVSVRPRFELGGDVYQRGWNNLRALRHAVGGRGGCI